MNLALKGRALIDRRGPNDPGAAGVAEKYRGMPRASLAQAFAALQKKFNFSCRSFPSWRRPSLTGMTAASGIERSEQTTDAPLNTRQLSEALPADFPGLCPTISLSGVLRTRRITIGAHQPISFYPVRVDQIALYDRQLVREEFPHEA